MPNLSFSTSGATPLNLANAQRLGLGNVSLTSDDIARKKLGLTPAANALNSITPPPPPAPTTPVKKTTVNLPDGSSHTTEYHAPEIQAAPNASTPGLVSPNENGHTTGTQHPGDAGFIVPNTTSQQQSSTPTFPGILGSLTSSSQNGSQTGKEYTDQTEQYAAGNIPIGQKASDIAADYGQKIAAVGQQGAQFEGGQLTTGTSPVAEGNAAVTAQTTAQQQQALATGEDAALQGTGQQLAAQGQAATASNAAAGQANTAQSNTQSGLISAGSLAQPSATGQGQTVFNPATGKFEGGSYQGNLSTVVDAIKNSKIGYSAGVDSLSGLSPTAKADVLAALGTGFDTVASDANAASRGSNIQTGGTATTGANAQGLAQSIQQETQLGAAANAAQSLASQVSNALQGAGLNLTNSTDANTAINNLQSRLGNAAYTQLNIAVNDARSQYAAILQSSGSATPTEAGNMANENISANMSPKQILAAIDQLNNGVKARQDAAHTQTQQFQNQLNSSGQNNSSNSGGTVQTKAGSVNTNW